jgi:betaine-aldehyde dehydrogenase
MTNPASGGRAIPEALRLPEHRGAYYGGAWHEPLRGGRAESINPGTGEVLASVADCSAADAEAAIAAAAKGFAEWRRVAPLERARILKRIAGILRDHAGELALIDAADCGNPVREMVGDAMVAAAQMEFFAGFVTEMKGASIPMGPDAVNFSVREAMGVVARIIPFNHPFMFCAGKSAAPLAAGNSVIVKPPEQAPLSSLRLAELLDGVLPAGVFNVVPGGKEVGATLASHPGVAKVALIGSVPTGRAVMRAAADTVKPVMLELGAYGLSIGSTPSPRPSPHGRGGSRRILCSLDRAKRNPGSAPSGATKESGRGERDETRGKGPTGCPGSRFREKGRGSGGPAYTPR